jgi:hypothetical protein
MVFQIEKCQMIDKRARIIKMERVIVIFLATPFIWFKSQSGSSSIELGRQFKSALTLIPSKHSIHPDS